MHQTLSNQKKKCFPQSCNKLSTFLHWNGLFVKISFIGSKFVESRDEWTSGLTLFNMLQ